MTSYNPHPVIDLRIRLGDAVVQARKRMKTHWSRVRPGNLDISQVDRSVMTPRKCAAESTARAIELINNAERVIVSLHDYEERKVGITTIKNYCKVKTLLESYAQKDPHFEYLVTVCTDFLDAPSYIEDYVTNYDAVDRFLNEIATLFPTRRLSDIIQSNAPTAEEIDAEDGKIHKDIDYEAFRSEFKALQTKYMHLFGSLSSSSTDTPSIKSTII